MKYQISATFQRTLFVWGQKGDTYKHSLKIAIGDDFLIYGTELVDEETVRFTPKSLEGFSDKPSEFLLHAGERVSFSYKHDYEMCGDMDEDVVNGVVELIPAEEKTE